MIARVGFSVAVHMKPDILMIDEALSTGDAHFREKANAKMAELRESARAMFLVSHGLGSIKEMCSEAIWLDRGKLMMRGEPADVVKAYIKFVKVKKSESATEDMYARTSSSASSKPPLEEVRKVTGFAIAATFADDQRRRCRLQLHTGETLPRPPGTVST